MAAQLKRRRKSTFGRRPGKSQPTGWQHRAVEQLEGRWVMDAMGGVLAGDLPEPLHGITLTRGAHDVAVPPPLIAVPDDYVLIASMEPQTLDVLANDKLPDPASNARISSVSPSMLGAQVTIAPDGRSIKYAPSANVQSFPGVADHLVYTLTDGAGEISMAPISIQVVPLVHTEVDTVALARGQSVVVDVLKNDIIHPTATDVRLSRVEVMGSRGSATITPDGKQVAVTTLADFPEGFGDVLHVNYTVSTGNGLEYLGRIIVTIQSPFALNSDQFELEMNSGPTKLEVLRNDRVVAGSRINQVQMNLVWPGQTNSGTVAIAPDGQSVQYTPDINFRGWESFWYTVSDPSGAVSAPAYVSVNVTARYTANDDYFGLHPSDAQDVRLDVLANDSRLPSEPVGKILDVSTIKGGTLRHDGNFVYFTADGSYLGDTSFQYRVQDSRGQIQAAQVNLSIGRAVLAVDDYQRVDSNSDWTTVRVLDNDYFAQLGYLLGDSTNTPPSSFRPQITEVQSSTGGTTRINASGRAIEFRPDADFRGVTKIKYQVTLASGRSDQGELVVEVGPQATDSAGRPIYSRLELEQMLVEESARRYSRMFGMHYQSNPWSPIFYEDASGVYRLGSQMDTVGPTQTGAYDSTNVQVAGVDEADLVKTDGRYLYKAQEQEIVILDAANPDDLKIVARIDLTGYVQSIYLAGSRLVVLQNAPVIYRFQMDDTATDLRSRVLVYDVSTPAAPEKISEIAYSGNLHGSRLVGNRVYLLTDQWLQLPELQSTCDAAGKECQYEDAETYWARLRAEGVEKILPTYAVTTYGEDGEPTVEPFTTASIYKTELSDRFGNLSSLAVLDVGAAQPKLLDMTSVDTNGWGVTSYVTENSYYLLRQKINWRTGPSEPIQQTEIIRFDIDQATGKVAIGATGTVQGRVLNQFSVDEHEGYLRIAATRDGTSTPSTNHIYVLQQQGQQLKIVGQVDNLALNESIFSARFLGDRAYLVTFRRIDPLFTIDLSNPTQPKVTGELKIPGFSSYLHPVGENYVIGVGRDVDPVSGWMQQPIVTLFDVTDMTRPREVDRDAIATLNWSNSEALWDHHAFNYYERYGVLALPIQGYQVGSPLPNGGFGPETYLNQLMVYRVNPAATVAENALELIGNVQQDSNVRRSLRIEEVLYAIADAHVTSTELLDPKSIHDVIYTGSTAIDDWADMSDAQANLKIEVLKNDVDPLTGKPLTSSSQVTVVSATASDAGGTVTVNSDGTITYVPPEKFTGTDVFRYTVSHPTAGRDTAMVSVQVHALPDAVDDTFTISKGTATAVLDVLRNDQGEFGWNYPIAYLDAAGRPAMADGLTSDSVSGAQLWRPIFNNLTISSVTQAENGTVKISEDRRQLTYSPAAGFMGIEEFTYTVQDPWGGTDTATVKVYVADGGVTVVNVDTGEDATEPGQLDTLSVQFSGDVSQRLHNKSLQLIQQSSGEKIDLSAAGMRWDGSTNTAAWDLSHLHLQPGEYEVQFDGQSLGLKLDGNGDGQVGDRFAATVEVSRLGDLDGDFDVDSSDLLKLVENYTGALSSPAPHITASSGDLDLDGDVDSNDVLTFLSSWTGSNNGSPPPADLIDLLFAAQYKP